MERDPAVISVMLAVRDAQLAKRWYREALGAEVMWDVGSVVGLRILGAPIFVGKPSANGWETAETRLPTCRVELFCEDPDSVIAEAIRHGATGRTDPARNHHAPWGLHRQGSFADPFGHIWLVGDKSPLDQQSRAESGTGTGEEP
jgi:uncharacterized glyoxalase superfamily protein PhnB